MHLLEYSPKHSPEHTPEQTARARDIGPRGMTNPSEWLVGLSLSSGTSGRSPLLKTKFSALPKARANLISVSNSLQISSLWLA